MNMKPVGCLVLALAVTTATWAQSTATAAGTVSTMSSSTSPQPKEDAQTKALREQLEREMAARKAEADAAIAADIARNPDGANAVAAREAEKTKKALEAQKLAVEEKAKADANADAKAAAAKAEDDRKAAAAAWEAGAPERARLAAQQKAAVDKWRATKKPAPSIIMGQRGSGTFTVMVDGQIKTFGTAAEAQAYADKIRSDADPALSY